MHSWPSYGIPERVNAKTAISLLIGVLVAAGRPAIAQSTSPPPSAPTQQPDSTSALEFLGSYTAPSAVLATETSHTSAHPPSPPASRRLHRIETGFDALAPWPWDFAWSTESIVVTCTMAGAGLERDISIADGALRAQRFGEALAGYDKVALAQAGCPAVTWNRAVAAAYAHSPGALANLTAALPQAPSPALAEMMLGLAELSAGDTAGAESNLLRFTEAAAGAQPAPGEASQVSPPLSGAGQPSAIPTERDFRWARAMLAQASREPVKARQELDRLSQMEPGCLTVWFALAGAALEEARAASRRLSEIAPKSEWDRRLQAEAVAARYPALAQSLWPGSLRAGQDKPGGAVSTSLDAKATESPESLYGQAHAALSLSQDAYSRVSQSPQFSAYLHALRALAAEQEGDEGAAIHEYQEGLAGNPASAVLHAGLGHLYWQRMDLRAAEPELERARTLDPGDPVVAFELGDVYQRLGRPQPGLAVLNEALRIDPEFLLARWSRAKVYLALGDSERALQDLEAAAPVDNSGDLQFQLARLYRKLGRADLAALAERHSEEQKQARQPLQVTESPRK